MTAPMQVTHIAQLDEQEKTALLQICGYIHLGKIDPPSKGTISDMIDSGLIEAKTHAGLLIPTVEGQRLATELALSQAKKTEQNVNEVALAVIAQRERNAHNTEIMRLAIGDYPQQDEWEIDGYLTAYTHKNGLVYAGGRITANPSRNADELLVLIDFATFIVAKNISRGLL